MSTLEIEVPGSRVNGSGVWPNLVERFDMAQRTCGVDDCNRDHYGHGYCENHMRRWKRTGSPLKLSIEDRFWSKVDKAETCWTWTDALDKDGYGSFWTGAKHVRPHRFSYELSYGKIPDGQEIDHVCHNRACVNPSPKHLRLATSKQNKENRRGAMAKNRSGHRGVSWLSTGWAAYVRHNGRTQYLGRFKTVQEAAEVARLKRLELFTHNDVDRVSR